MNQPAPTRGPILVTGAEEHQGLAVIRGLGRAGWPVIACGVRPRSIGFASRYATRCYRYANPAADPDRFIADIMTAIRATRPALIVPSVETTLVILNEHRDLVERSVPIAAPPAETLDIAIDKARTLQLADRLGVPAPRTVCGATADELLHRADTLRFPVAVKPRGHRLHASTVNRIHFKSRYAHSMDELRDLLLPLSGDAGALLVQEYAPGVGRCVAAVCDRGTPLAMFAYERDREYPRSGGVSVVRTSIPLDNRLCHYTSVLLQDIAWQGVAMVEFKYDVATDQYRLMEINGRFQASTALSLDAGLNLPHLAACVFTGVQPPSSAAYRVGVRERWLRGDLLTVRDARANPATRRRALTEFFSDSLRSVHFDEFTRDDWKPGALEALSLTAMLGGWMREWIADGLRRLWCYSVRARRASATASAAAQRSIRA